MAVDRKAGPFTSTEFARRSDFDDPQPRFELASGLLCPTVSAGSRLWLPSLQLRGGRLGKRGRTACEPAVALGLNRELFNPAPILGLKTWTFQVVLVLKRGPISRLPRSLANGVRSKNACVDAPGDNAKE